MDKTEQLRKRVIDELKRLDLLKQDVSKEAYRSLHYPAVRIQLEQQQNWIKVNFPKYENFFANGTDIIPKKIQPQLIEVTDEWQANLFRLARLTWSLPFTKGYGRRLRFLIFDASNNKLIGVLGLQSPPLDFAIRDRLFSYPSGQKINFVNQTMDIYTLGAVPPYNNLLGGKLVALAASSSEIRNTYCRKYKDRITEIEGRILPAHLVALTTTSAFGRSSIYNRLKFKQRHIAKSIGYTEGYGSFHLSSLYSEFREFLTEAGISTKGGFGVGPRIVWQTIVRALRQLGLSEDLLKHGLKREAFLYRLCNNLEDYMSGQDSTPEYCTQNFSVLSAWWQERWLLPRAARLDDWRFWDKQDLQRYLVFEQLDLSKSIDMIEELNLVDELKV